MPTPPVVGAQPQGSELIDTDHGRSLRTVVVQRFDPEVFLVYLRIIGFLPGLRSLVAYASPMQSPAQRFDSHGGKNPSRASILPQFGHRPLCPRQVQSGRNDVGQVGQSLYPIRPNLPGPTPAVSGAQRRQVCQLEGPDDLAGIRRTDSRLPRRCGHPLLAQHGADQTSASSAHSIPGSMGNLLKGIPGLTGDWLQAKHGADHLTGL